MPVTFTLADFIDVDALVTMIKTIATGASPLLIGLVSALTVVGVGAGLLWKAKSAVVKAVVR